MSNDVVIRVRVRQDARDGFAAVGKEAETEGQRSAEKFTSRFGGVMTRMGQMLREPMQRAGKEMGEHAGDEGGKSFVTKLTNVVTSQVSKLTQLGQTVGKTVGDSVSTQVTESVVRGVRDANGRLRDDRGRIIGGAGSGGTASSSSTRGARGGRGGAGGSGGSVDVDVDKQSLLSRLGGWGKEAALGFASNFSAILGGIFSGDIWSKLLLGAGAVAIGWAVAAPLASAIVSGILLVLGGGAIAAGVVAAFKDPRIQAAADELKGRLNRLFAKFGEPFRGPVANFLEKLNDFVTKMTPNFEHLARVLAPVADKLGSGIIGMLQNMLPGLIDAIEGSAPVFDVLADRLPDIGQALGDFFREIGEHGDEASVFFNDLITVLIKVINWVGKLIGFFVRLYAGVREFASDAISAFLEFGRFVIGIFEKLLDSALIAFGWMPGLGGKLRTAQAQFVTFRKEVNAELGKIKDKTVTIRMKTFGLAGANAAVGVAEQLAALGYASGGIVGKLPIGQAASGGVRAGLTLVGERGPELADLAPGSRVWSAGDSNRMSAREGGDAFVARAVYDGGSSEPLIRDIMKHIQIIVERRFGGSVQAAMGRG